MEEDNQDFEAWLAQASTTTKEQLLGFSWLVRVTKRSQAHNPKEVMRAINLAMDVKEELRASHEMQGS